MSEAAPLALADSGAEVSVVCAAPDGVNINAGCGSTHIGALQEMVAADGFDLGLAFDGDGDRVLAVDASGQLVDGDFIIAILARHLKAKGTLRNDTVVTTVMTNLGFHHAMEREGIAVLVTPVGDRYVVAEMLKGDHVLGGEQSGHIVNRDVSTTGDGLATAFLLLQALGEMQVPLADAAQVMMRLPQRLLNVRVRDLAELPSAAAVWAAVDEESRSLAGRGRVLVRPSGTEPLVRVMAEAESEDQVEDVCRRIAAVVNEHLGETASADAVR
jgi:phosphoglucosamine mutase